MQGQFVNRISDGFHLKTTKGITYRIHRQGDRPDGTIDRIFWTYDWCLDQWRKNFEVIAMDCTYKVNKYNMPLLQICGITALHTTFNIGYRLLSGDKEDCFLWVLQQMRDLMTLESITNPYVIITDYDKALKKACRAVFNNDVQHQICIWHIMKNVVLNVKKKWNGTLEGTALRETGPDGSHLPDEDDEGHDASVPLNPADRDPVAARVGARLLDGVDR